jgi:hypothetical protein
MSSDYVDSGESDASDDEGSDEELDEDDMFGISAAVGLPFFGPFFFPARAFCFFGCGCVVDSVDLDLGCLDAVLVYVTMDSTFARGI